MRSYSVLFASLIAVSAVGRADATDWTGFYAGGFGGVAWVDTAVSTTLAGSWASGYSVDETDRQALLPLLNRDLSTTGALGGIALGYNAQSGAFVGGIEVDVSVLDSEAGHTFSTIQPGPQPYKTETSASLDWLGTARLRAGWAFDRTLVYATGGIAVGEVSFRQDIIQGNVNFQQLSSANDTQFGWVVGGGIEHALTERWSLKVQYLHVELDAISMTSSGACQTTCSPSFAAAQQLYTGDHKADVMLDTVSAGINYRF